MIGRTGKSPYEAGAKLAVNRLVAGSNPARGAKSTKGFCSWSQIDKPLWVPPGYQIADGGGTLPHGRPVPEAPMTTQHFQNLQRLREQSVAQRRSLVNDLANPNERGGAQDVRDLFLKLQETIEAIDRAMEDEARESN